MIAKTQKTPQKQQKRQKKKIYVAKYAKFRDTKS